MEIKALGYKVTITLKRYPETWVEALIRDAKHYAKVKHLFIDGGKGVSTKIERIRTIRFVKNPFPPKVLSPVGEYQYRCDDDGLASLRSAKDFVERFWYEGL